MTETARRLLPSTRNRRGHRVGRGVQHRERAARHLGGGLWPGRGGAGGDRGSQAGGREPHLCNRHQPGCAVLHAARAVLGCARCAVLCWACSSSRWVGGSSVDRPTVQPTHRPADKFVAAMEWGATDCVNPKDHGKPIQQVCLGGCCCCPCRPALRARPGLWLGVCGTLHKKQATQLLTHSHSLSSTHAGAGRDVAHRLGHRLHV